MAVDLSNALPELRSAFAKLTAETPIKFHVAAFGGVRTHADTELILGYRAADYAVACAHDPSVKAIPINTWRPIAPYGSSYHNYGAAFDVVIDDIPGVDYSDDPDGLQADGKASLGELAPSCGLRWGGTFPPSTLDPSHFELPITLAAAKAEWDSTPHSPFGFASYAAIGVILLLGVFILLLRNL